MSLIVSSVFQVLVPCFSVCGKASSHIAPQVGNHSLAWEALQGCSLYNWGEAISYHGLALVSPCSLSPIAHIYGLNIFLWVFKGKKWDPFAACSSWLGETRCQCKRVQDECVTPTSCGEMGKHPRKITSCLLHAEARYNDHSVRYLHGKTNHRITEC